MKNTILLLLCLCLSTSCEDVVNVELDTTAPVIIIEATITNEPGPYPIYISQTNDFFDAGEYPTISGATVIVSDDSGVIDTCTEKSPGAYYTNHIQGQAGSNYSLQVKIGDQTYTAQSQMPEFVKLDALEYVYSEAIMPGDTAGYIVKCQFMDPEDQDNYYRIKSYRNGKLYQESGSNVVTWNDATFNGINADLPVKKGGKMFKENDTIRVELLSVNPDLFRYFIALGRALTTTSSGIDELGSNMVVGNAAPGNPPSNISNEAMGYFATYTHSEASVILIP